MINLLTGEVKPFSPDFMCTTQIPVKYAPDSSTGTIADFFKLAESKIMTFLYEVMAHEDVELFLDFLAYCLWREYRFNFWLLCNGAGQNGKSILLQLIERFLGKVNVSGETLDRLLHERFSGAMLYGKMVNVDADVSADVIFDNTGILKKLTGNDLHPAEFKYKKPFAFRNYAKLIFSCNKIPDTQDLTDAFFRRLLIINFTQQFFGERDDLYIIDKLCTEKEFSALLNELLTRLPRIIKRGIREITNESMSKTYDKYTLGSNPVKFFYERGIELKPGNKVKKLDLYEHYGTFCKEKGLAPESDQSFSRRLTEIYKLKCKRGRDKSEQAYFWLDIGCKDWKAEELLQEANDEALLKQFFSHQTQEANK